MDKNTNFKYDENRALVGYGSAWLVALPENGGKYSLIGFTESVPYPYGEKESFDFNILQQASMGQVQGKTTLETVDVPVMHHRDNAYRYNKLVGKPLNFMSVNSEFVGYKFTGTIDYRPDTAEGDIHRATVTITPLSASTQPTLNARPEMMDTLAFAYSIPPTVAVGEAINCAVKQTAASVTVTVKAINADNAEAETDSATITGTSVTIGAEGLYAITVSAAGYASWTTTVYVEAKA